MNYLIYINKLPELVLVKVPEKPTRCRMPECDDLCKCDLDLEAYSKLLNSALFDESKHIRFRDDQPIVQLLWSVNDDGYPHRGRWLNKRKGQTFPLPEGVSVRFEEEIDEYVYPYGSMMKKVALLVQEPKVEEQDNNFDGSTQFELNFGDRFIKVNCPDEDSDIYIQVRHIKPYTVSLDTHTAEEILKKYKSNEDNLCLAGKYTLEDSAIISAMTEYASLRDNKAKRWISVKEELPQIGRKVFIIDDYIKYPDNVFSGIYYGAGVWHKSENITPCPKGRVTHWMPLPEAP